MNDLEKRVLTIEVALAKKGIATRYTPTGPHRRGVREREGCSVWEAYNGALREWAEQAEVSLLSGEELEQRLHALNEADHADTE